MEMFFKIEVACDTHESENFVNWLIRHGHRAYVGSSTGSFVSDARDSENYSCDEELYDPDEIMGDLWGKYCNEED